MNRTRVVLATELSLGVGFAKLKLLAKKGVKVSDRTRGQDN